MSEHTHQSVCISSTVIDCALVEWCRQVMGTVGGNNARSWSWHRRCVYPRHISTNCCVFSFIDARHKLMFDLAWGHLGIHNSVQSLEHQLDRELV